MMFSEVELIQVDQIKDRSWKFFDSNPQPSDE